MSAGKMFGTGFRILAVCLLFAVCFAIGGALAGVARIAQEAPPVKATPAEVVLPFVTFASAWESWFLI